MKRIDIFFINKFKDNINILKTGKKSIIVKINIKDLTNYDIGQNINKIKEIINLYDKIQRINIIFDPTKIIDLLTINKILAKLNDILYSYYPVMKEFKLYNVTCESKNFMNELITYKNVVMDPNKNPDTYLIYVLKRIPADYTYNLIDINKQ